MKIMGILSSLLAVLGAGGCSGLKTVSPDEFEKVISDPEVRILDVRTAEEFAAGHLGGAVNIDWYGKGFVKTVEESFDKSTPLAVYCRSGKRSAAAGETLLKAGFETVWNLDGGYLAWKGAEKPVAVSPYEVDAFNTLSGKTVKFYALMHASILIEYDGKVIYVDPVRSLGDRKVDYSVLPGADLVLVTHEHGDHFDKEVLEELTMGEVVTNARCAEMLGHGEVLSNGEKKTALDGVTIEAVPAYNITEGRTQFHPKGRDNGYILTLDGLRIYIAGDTEDIPEMAAIKDIDIAFLPCNQPYTMTPDQLIRAAKIIAPKVLFPYHYGATDVTGISAELPGIDVRIRQYQ